MIDIIKHEDESNLLEEEEEVMMESSEIALLGNEDDSLAFDASQTAGSSSSGSRQWHKDNGQTNGYNISVGITTRDESLPIYDTPCKMYSSLRYKLHYKCSVNSEQVTQLPKLLMCRITVIDDDSGKEIKKDNKPIIDDSLISLKNTSNAAGNFGVFEANHKIKFKSVSFHHNKSKWRLLLQLYSDSNHSINTPVFVMKSAPFQVYARRPKVSERDSSNGLLSSSTSQTISKEEKRKKKSESKKRKRASSVAGKDVKQEDSTTTEEEPTPVTNEEPACPETPTVCSTSTAVTCAEDVPVIPTNPKKIKLMENFKNSLELLLKHHSEMDDEDRLAGFGLIQQRMFEYFYGQFPPEMMMTMVEQAPCPTENNNTEVMQCGSADDLMISDFNSSLFGHETTTDSDLVNMPNDNNHFSIDMDYLNNHQIIEDFSSFI